MSRPSVRRSFLSLTLGALIYWFASPASSEPARSSKLTFSVEDIGESVTLIGRLGKPLGQQCEIRGKWALPSEEDKDDSLRFTVLEVDGVRLVRPIEFNIGQMTARTVKFENALPNYENRDSLDGEEWRMFACENGRTEIGPNVPAGKPDMFRAELMARPYYLERFTSELDAIVVSRGKSKAQSPVQQRPRSK